MKTKFYITNGKKFKSESIQGATALTLIFIHNMRSYCKRNSVLE